MSAAQTTDEVAILETREASPTHFLMKVESFSLLGKHQIHRYESGEFDAGGQKWRLIICPNEDETGKDNKYISVYLAISDTTSVKPANWEVNAVFSIFLFNQISGNYHYSTGKTRRFVAIMKSEYGFSKFMSKEVMMNASNGFLINNNCVFGAEIFIVEKSAASECLSLKSATVPSKREWKVPNSSKLGYIWTSGRFLAEGFNWDVSVKPEGNDEKGRSLSIYLRLHDSKRVKASFSVCLKDQTNRKGRNHKKSSSNWLSNSQRGWKRFIGLASFEDPANGYIVDDTFLLEIEIFVQAVV